MPSKTGWRLFADKCWKEYQGTVCEAHPIELFDGDWVLTFVEDCPCCQNWCTDNCECKKGIDG